MRKNQTTAFLLLFLYREKCILLENIFKET